MALTVVSEPSVEPIVASDVVTHLRISRNDENTYLNSLAKRARIVVEQATNRALITQTLKLTRNAFPACSAIQLERAPLQEVTSVRYRDTSEAWQTFTSSYYTVSTATSPGKVTLNHTRSWPTVSYNPDAVEVTYTAGYGDTADDVPEDLKQAILMLVGHWYANRESVIVQPGVAALEVPHSFDSLVMPHKVWM